MKKSHSEYLIHKEQARNLVKEKILKYNKHYNFEIKRISIRDQKTRWGSCSSKGNLNFNYRIIFLPEALTDYIVVHELCHLKEFNHSSKFWDLVSETISDYKSIRRGLQKIPLRTTSYRLGVIKLSKIIFSNL